MTNASPHTTKYALERQNAALIAARKLNEFTARQLAEQTGTGIATARRRINIWRDAGECELLRTEGKAQVFRLTEEVATSPAPDLNRNSPEAAFWTAMRILRRFDPTDVIASISAARAGLELHDARAYCQLLMRAGYLRCIAPAKPGKREACYQLVKNTGPMAPHPRRLRVLIDPNEGGVAWVPKVPA